MRSNLRLFVLVGVLVGLALALFVSPFASAEPDGLEKVSAEEGIDGTTSEHDLADGPLADYGVEGIDDERVGTGVAGLIGTLVALGLGLGVFALIRVLRSRQDREGRDRGASALAG